MVKVLFWITGFCATLAIAVIPETIMYFIYHSIQPQTELGKIIMFLAFWLGGAGACVGFAVVAFILFLAISKAVMA